MSLVLAIAFCFCMVIPASAMSIADVGTSELDVTTQAYNPPASPNSAARAACAGYIPGGGGQLPCTLGRYISSGYVQAAVSSNNSSGTVSCWVELPNGATQYLGTVPAAGGSTPMVPMYTLVSGTYYFIFQSTTTSQLNVSGYIYD